MKLSSLIVFIAFLGQLSYADDSDYATALCGPKADHKDPAQENIKLHEIEKNMPPVQNQSSTDWCGVFSACDLENYNLRLNRIAKGEPEDYSTSNLISQMDAAFIVDQAEEKNKTPPSTSSGVLDMNKSVEPGNLLTAFSDAGLARSQNQISFSAIEENIPEAKAIVNDVVAHYSSKKTVDPQVVEPITGLVCKRSAADEIKKRFETFEPINNWLNSEARKTQPQFNGHVIGNYETIACEKGEPDITLPKFSVNSVFLTQKPITLVNLISKALEEKQPVSTPVCVYDLTPIPKGAKDNCGKHALTLVGAAYVNGKCTVRLKNSWGNGWGDHGYFNVEVGKWITAMRSDYTASWISPQQEKSKVYYDAFNGEGEMNVAHGKTKAMKNGSTVWPNGSKEFFEGGKRKRLENFLMGDNKSRYTGTLSPAGGYLDGIITGGDGKQTIMGKGAGE